ncbi:hypothetical protein JN01_0365 [Entomoplasma freundtii]|uniref:Uncharacterized protein n=1 Tax=Entomoplasma freundtii TaxID=74700 RepID=A0A2K8NUC5_9MOLU|nr:hypothetical protein [Entomoplasma freundtii]ATZ16223.1 hypothetical protein EFREU_v1c01960 [Entomoplasma freundtii]TDY56876.1 hypothetical protein JN01_0365 [Entomoplasma freundtii]
MDSQHIWYLIGAIATFIGLFFFGIGLWWQIKMKHYEQKKHFVSQNGRGIKDYYNVFIYYIFAFCLTADFLGFILLMTLLFKR